MSTQEGLFIVGDSQGTGARGGWPYCMAKSPKLKNLAVGSTALVDDMEPSYATNVAATNPSSYQYAVIQGGVNDIIADNALSAMQDAITSMASTANTAGFDLYVMGVAPWKNGTGWSAARQTKTDDFNSWLSSNAASLSFTYIDVYTPLEDGVNPDELNSSYDVGDGIHLNNAGYIIWAQQLEAQITLTEVASVSNELKLWRGAVQPAETSPSGNEIKLWRGAVEPQALSASFVGEVSRDLVRDLAQDIVK